MVTVGINKSVVKRVIIDELIVRDVDIRIGFYFEIFNIKEREILTKKNNNKKGLKVERNEVHLRNFRLSLKPFWKGIGSTLPHQVKVFVLTLPLVMYIISVYVLRRNSYS